MKKLALLVGAVTLMMLLALACGAVGRACEDASDDVLDAVMDTIDASDGE
jgi:hypothetical protein